MAQTDTNPSLYNQFEIWRFAAPMGKGPAVIKYVLVVSKTDTLTFDKEPYLTVLPLYFAHFQSQMMPSQVQLPFIRGGENSLHELPYDCLVGTHGVFTTRKKNLAEKISFLNDDIQQQVKKQLRERLDL